MRSRLLTLMLAAILAMSFAGCSKKDQSQNTAAPATDTSTAAQSNQAAAPSQPAQSQMAQQPAQQPAQSQPMAPAPTQQAQAPEPPPPPPPLVVPAGTSLVVRMGNSITSKTANAGDTFTGSLAHGVTVDGVVAIRAGAGVSGTVVDAKSPGRFKGEGILSIALTAVNVGGGSVPIQTSTYTQTVKGKGKRTAVMAGGGTGAGALIGGLAGGGKGALIGGLVGAGAGTAGAAFTGNKELTIPAESAVTFKLANSITVQRPARRSFAGPDGSHPVSVLHRKCKGGLRASFFANPVCLLVSVSAPLRRPALFCDLSPTSYSQGIGRYVFGNARSRADVCALANSDRRHQRGIAADEGSVFNRRSVLVDAIVIAGDGARPDVHAFTNFGVAQIGEVVGLRTFA